MVEPARRVDFLASGVVSTVGAGLFTGLAPAASLAGVWLLLAFVVAAVLGCLVIESTSRRPIGAAPPGVRPLVFGLGALGRLAAAVAVAGTCGRYLTPERPELGAVALAVVVTAAAVVVPRPPVAVVRFAAAAVLVALALVVVACFAIAPVAPAVAVADGGSPLGFLACVGLLTVCFLGGSPPARPVVDVRLPPLPGADDRVAGERSGGGTPAAPLWRGPGRPGGRLGVVGLVAVVLVVCLAVGVAALRQLGAPRLALSPAPLLDALAAADASALDPLLSVGVAVACGFVLLGILRWLTAAGGEVPAVRVKVAAGAVVAAGGVLVEPVVALGAAAVLLLGDAVLRYVAVRHQRVR